MMHRILKVAAAGVIVVSLAACQGMGPKGTVGAMGGAAAGGLLGATLGGGATGIAAGVLLGGLLGGAVGDSMDQADRRYAAQTTARSLETTQNHRTSQWRNPNNGHYGTVTPTRTYQRSSGQYCREYQQTVTVGGRQQSAYGTACRQPDGSWQVQYIHLKARKAGLGPLSL